MPFQQTTFDNTYQTMPDDDVELLEPDQVQRAPARRRDHEWLMRKDQCMHCEDPGCLRACPADGAIVQYTNGIVDFQQENCIGCQYCISGCPSTFRSSISTTKKVYKCTLCSDRVGQGLEPACIKSCPTGCLKFGTKTDMRALAERARQAAPRALRIPECGRVRPAVDRRHTRHLRPARHHEAGTVRRTAGESTHPTQLHGLEAVREADRAGAQPVRAAGGLSSTTSRRARRNRSPPDDREGEPR